MKKTAIAAFLATTIGVSQPAFSSGIPVFDVSSVAQQLIQVEHLLSQIEQMKNQLENASGVRGMANVIDSIYDTAVEIDRDQVLEQAGIRNSGEHGLSGTAAEVYDLGNENTADWLGQSEKSLQQAQERFGQLNGLIAEVNNSPDQKDILDLHARIAAEEVMLQNEMAKLTMLNAQAQANEAMHDRRIQQMSIESSGELRDVSW